ncbi:MAG TPA: hypothetical protein ENI87_01955 [bacterium]|nr:hypothetical protein [bacterium]
MSLLSVACAGTLRAQQVWKVFSGGGPGVHFTDLPPAVAAAAPGDEIWVYSQVGAFWSYTPTIITRGIRIVGFKTGSPPNSTGPSSASFDGLFVIVGLPAGEQVTLSNLNVWQAMSGDPAGIVAVDCAGDIVIEGCGTSAYPLPYPPFSGSALHHRVHFENCANVVIHGSTFVMYGSPLTAINTNLRFLSSEVLYGPALQNCYFCPINYLVPTEGIRLVDSNMTMVSSVIHGGSPTSANQGWPAQPAAVLADSSLVVGPHSRLYGGGSSPGSLASAYTASPASTVAIDHRAVVNGIPSAGLPSPVWMSSIATPWVVGGQPYDILVSGEPGGFAVVASGDWAPVALPTAIGGLSLVPSTMVFSEILPLGPPTVFSPGGDAALTLDCPVTAPVAHPFALQAMTLAPSGMIELSEPAVFTVAWPRNRTP